VTGLVENAGGLAVIRVVGMMEYTAKTYTAEEAGDEKGGLENTVAGTTMS